VAAPNKAESAKARRPRPRRLRGRALDLAALRSIPGCASPPAISSTRRAGSFSGGIQRIRATGRGRFENFKASSRDGIASIGINPRYFETDKEPLTRTSISPLSVSSTNPRPLLPEQMSIPDGANASRTDRRQPLGSLAADEETLRVRQGLLRASALPFDDVKGPREPVPSSFAPWHGKRNLRLFPNLL
jgi:hypothetical protein